MANDAATDFSGILGKLGPAPGGGLFGGTSRALTHRRNKRSVHARIYVLVPIRH
jgi:hypothetical protein